jgi:segregation and condensation protein B
MFATTKQFLDYFGLKKLDDLPPLADLSDWESLRVQLNLPEVEEDTSDEAPVIPELPVLYPEIEEDKDDIEKAESTEASEETADEDGDAPSEADADKDELVVSEWPDPVESGG